MARFRAEPDGCAGFIFDLGKEQAQRRALGLVLRFGEYMGRIVFDLFAQSDSYARS